MADKLKMLDLFSGIGAFSLGLERSGLTKTVAFCEIEPSCRKALKAHWPDVPCAEDIRNLSYAGGKLLNTYDRSDTQGIYDLKEVIYDGPIDCICGGFPCTDVSLAGKGAGIGGSQSQLWKEYARLIGEIRPRYVIVENVAALLGRGLGTVLGDLAALRYDAEWDCIPATFVGAPHNRDRIWIIAYPFGHVESWEESCFWQIGRMGGVEQSISWDRTWENTLSTLRGMDDGLARSVDRTDAIRNAVVPQIPELIGYAILEAEKARTG